MHRAGRTGRQGAAGVVLSLLKRDEASRAFARGAARLLSAAGLPSDAALAELAGAPALAAGVQGPQAPLVQQAPPEEPPTREEEPAAVGLAMGGDLLAFAASFAG